VELLGWGSAALKTGASLAKGAARSAREKARTTAKSLKSGISDKTSNVGTKISGSIKTLLKPRTWIKARAASKDSISNIFKKELEEQRIWKEEEEKKKQKQQQKERHLKKKTKLTLKKLEKGLND